jgi:hypothetical protein
LLLAELLKLCVRLTTWLSGMVFDCGEMLLLAQVNNNNYYDEGQRFMSNTRRLKQGRETATRGTKIYTCIPADAITSPGTEPRGRRAFAKLVYPRLVVRRGGETFPHRVHDAPDIRRHFMRRTYYGPRAEKTLDEKN